MNAYLVVYHSRTATQQAHGGLIVVAASEAAIIADPVKYMGNKIDKRFHKNVEIDSCKCLTDHPFIFDALDGTHYVLAIMVAHID